MQALLRDPAVRMRSHPPIQALYDLSLSLLGESFDDWDLFCSLAEIGKPAWLDNEWGNTPEEKLRIAFDTCLAQGAMEVRLFARLLSRCGESYQEAHAFDKLVTLWGLELVVVSDWLKTGDS